MEDVTWSIENSRQFVFEYYYEAASVTKPKRSFTYKWTAPAPMENVNIEIQEPLRVKNFKVARPGGASRTDDQGFKYVKYTYSGVSKGQSFEFPVSYTKSDSNPSVEKNQNQAQATRGEIPSGTVGTSNTNTYVLPVLIVLLAGAAFMFYRSQQQKTRYGRKGYGRPGKTKGPARANFKAQTGGGPGRSGAPGGVPGGKKGKKGKKGRGPSGGPSGGPTDGKVRFCPSCGTQLEGVFRFCPDCGNELP